MISIQKKLDRPRLNRYGLYDNGWVRALNCSLYLTSICAGTIIEAGYREERIASTLDAEVHSRS